MFFWSELIRLNEFCGDYWVLRFLGFFVGVFGFGSFLL